MAKIHLQGNKAENGQQVYAICALRSTRLGKVAPNGRNTYRFMASEIVRYAEFEKIASEDRCAHCMDCGLELKNRQRKAKGKGPVAHLFDKA